MRGVRLSYTGKYHYWPINAIDKAYAVCRSPGDKSFGRVTRKRHPGQKTFYWVAVHRQYPGAGDFGTGRTRDEAVDNLLSIVGEG